MLLTSNKSYHHDSESSYLILSVDDDPINQLVVENLLLPEGCYQLQQCMGGIEALEFLATHPVLPDLILLDIMMPDVSGYEVCEEIRRTYNETIPIVVVSAKDSPDDIARGLELGANDYVKKPFHRTEMLSRVKALLRNQAMIKSAMNSTRSDAKDGTRSRQFNYTTLHTYHYRISYLCHYTMYHQLMLQLQISVCDYMY